MAAKKPKLNTAVVIGGTGLIGSSLLSLIEASVDYARATSLVRQNIVTKGKIDTHCVDFSKPNSFAEYVHGDVLFSCMGTTKKRAGSIAAQRVVDVEYQLEVAKIAAKNGVPHYCLVSSSGADASSSNEYMKMKGELEDAVIALGFERVTIFQPSLLVGLRPEFRFGEVIGEPILSLLTKIPSLQKYRPISGKQVAKKMLETSLSKQTGLRVFKLDEIF
jgi:uncharacterized protein YbjT (DUF2867 family)